MLKKQEGFLSQIDPDMLMAKPIAKPIAKLKDDIPPKVKKFEKLSDVLDFATKKHRDINGDRNGVIGYKMIRKPSGKRILFEEIKGFRIFKFEVIDTNSVVVDTLAAGFKFKNNEKITVSSRLILSNLMVINIYDHRADFFSLDGIDFMYIENNQSCYELLTEWMNDQQSELRAQWLSSHDDVDRILYDTNRDAALLGDEVEDRSIDFDLNISCSGNDRDTCVDVPEETECDIYSSDFEV